MVHICVKKYSFHVMDMRPAKDCKEVSLMACFTYFLLGPTSFTSMYKNSYLGKKNNKY